MQTHGIAAIATHVFVAGQTSTAINGDAPAGAEDGFVVRFNHAGAQ